MHGYQQNEATVRDPVGPDDEKARALVRREPPREADRQHVGVQLPRMASRDDVLEQPLLRAAVRSPQVLRRQLPRPLELRVGVAEQALELAGDPCPLVDAVRDRSDWDLVAALLR